MGKLQPMPAPPQVDQPSSILTVAEAMDLLCDQAHLSPGDAAKWLGSSNRLLGNRTPRDALTDDERPNVTGARVRLAIRAIADAEK